MKAIMYFLFFAGLCMLNGCTPLTLRPADFSWPVEVATKPDSAGIIHQQRYQVAFNIKALVFEETKDSTKILHYSFHVIRDQKGFYYITAKDFKNVYVFAGREGSLVLERKISISEKGLKAPAFNQKAPFIQLVNEADEDEKPLLLSENGIQQGASK